MDPALPGWADFWCRPSGPGLQTPLSHVHSCLDLPQASHLLRMTAWWGGEKLSVRYAEKHGEIKKVTSSDRSVPRFPASRHSQLPVCGFLSKKAAWNLPAPPRSTGNLGERSGGICSALHQHRMQRESTAPPLFRATFTISPPK